MRKKCLSHPERRRVRTPRLLQMAAFECGAVALGIILSHYGRWLPMDELRRACGVSTRGVTAAGMLGAARRYGLHAQGYRVQHIQQLEALPPPFIVYWNINHFVVVEGFAGDHIYLNDPASGERRVTRAEFAQAFSGVVLTFAPGSDFQPGGALPALWPKLVAHLHGLEGALLALLLLALLLAVVGLAVPLAAQTGIDSAVGFRPVSPLPVLLLGVAVLVGAVLAWLQQGVLAHLETSVAWRGAQDYTRHLLRLPRSFIALRYAGDLARRISLNDAIAALLSGQAAATVQHTIMAVLFVGVLLWYDPLLGGVGAVLASLHVLALRLLEHHHRHNQQRVYHEQQKLFTLLEDGLHAVETLKATGCEAALLRRLQQQYARLARAARPLASHAARLALLPVIFAAVVPVVIFLGGALRVQTGVLTPGELVAVYLLTMGLAVPLRMLTYLAPQLRAAGDYSRQLDDVLQMPAAPMLAAQETTSSKQRETAPSLLLTLRGITMGYVPGEPPLLNNVNLEIGAGCFVALVGNSGSGKSTLAAIAAGLEEPWIGEVHGGGKVFLVEQQPVLFDGTIRDNLTLWDATIPEANIIQAARDACIHEVIVALPQGYDTPLHDNGQRLSGGERQRLALARALVHMPDLLLLDEATSAIDPATRQRIFANLRRRQCSALIIAHRADEVQGCDEIVVLEGGQTVERASPDTPASNEQARRRLLRHYQREQHAARRETLPAVPALPSPPLTLRGVLWWVGRGSMGNMLIVASTALIGGVALLSLPLAVARIFDAHITGAADTWPPLACAMCVLLLLTFLAVVAQAMQHYALQRIEQQSDERLALALWQHIFALPVSLLCRFAPAELAGNTIAFANTCRAAVNAGAATMARVLLALAPLALLFAYSATAGTVAATLAVLFLGAVILISRLLARDEYNLAAQEQQQQQMLAQFVSGQATLRTARAEPRALLHWAKHFRACRAHTQRLHHAFGTLEMLTTAFLPLMVAAALALLPLAAPQITPGQHIAVLIVVVQVSTALLPLAFTAHDLVAVIPLFGGVRSLLTDPLKSAGSVCFFLGWLRGDIRVEGVSFCYEPHNTTAPLALDNISLHIEPGDCVALMGASGSGKSTLARLLLGFATPQRGAIFYDGHETGQLDMAAVRVQMGVVLQQQRILPGDMWHNIVGERNLSPRQVERAAALVGLDEIIRQLPMGLKTPLTEGGITLSEGQRQQIFLARALAAQPAVVLLDEATSALDEPVQQRIFAHLARTRATRIIITHDPRLAALADRVVTLERGRIVSICSGSTQRGHCASCAS